MMQATITRLSYEVELAPGETLQLPQRIVDSVGPGQWLVTIEPIPQEAPAHRVRGHSAFLNSYAPEDEGLYDDYPAG
jgi:hypothetical protein